MTHRPDSLAAIRDHLTVAANNPIAHGGIGGLRQFMREASIRIAKQIATLEASPDVADFARGVNAAISWVENRRHDYGNDYGRVNPNTNALEFGSSDREEYYCELSEIEEGLRTLSVPKASKPVSGVTIRALGTGLHASEVTPGYDDGSGRIRDWRQSAPTAGFANKEGVIAKLSEPVPLENQLVRYGRTSDGALILFKPMADGYWTPWHIAARIVAELRAEIDETENVALAAIEKRKAAEQHAKALAGLLLRCKYALVEAMAEYGIKDGDQLTRRIEALLAERDGVTL